MTEKRVAKRGELREGLLAAAQARITGSGLRGLRARDVTSDAGTALGGLYNAFDDLDDLILHVNAKTLSRLRASARERLAEADGPRAALQALAAAYFAFARENFALWSALFEHQVAAEKGLPEWFTAEQEALIRLIEEPLALLLPGLDEAARLIRARTLFGAIHGIVAISTERRFVGVPDAALEGELVWFVDVIASGLKQGSADGQAPA